MQVAYTVAFKRCVWYNVDWWHTKIVARRRSTWRILKGFPSFHLDIWSYYSPDSVSLYRCRRKKRRRAFLERRYWDHVAIHLHANIWRRVWDRLFLEMRFLSIFTSRYIILIQRGNKLVSFESILPVLLANRPPTQKRALSLYRFDDAPRRRGVTSNRYDHLVTHETIVLYWSHINLLIRCIWLNAVVKNYIRFFFLWPLVSEKKITYL